MPIESPYLTSREAAAYLRTSVPTLERWRAAGVGPRFTRCGQRILYHRQDLDAWLANQRTDFALRPLPERLTPAEWQEQAAGPAEQRATAPVA